MANWQKSRVSVWISGISLPCWLQAEIPTNQFDNRVLMICLLRSDARQCKRLLLMWGLHEVLILEVVCMASLLRGFDGWDPGSWASACQGPQAMALGILPSE